MHMEFHKRYNPLAELQHKDRVVGTWVDDLQSRFGWMCVWEHVAVFLIDLENGDVLFDSVLQPLRSTTNIPTATVARKLVSYVTLNGRKYIFLVCGTQIYGGINNTWFQSSKACFACSFNLFFKFCCSGANVQ